VWRVAIKDLLFRRRRFITSVLATSIAFGLALLLSGAEEHLRRESERIVGLFQADVFVVAEGSSGPFSTTRLLPAAMADEVAADPGVTTADAFVQVREVIEEQDVNVLGLTPGGAGWPEPAEGRLPAGPNEVIVDELLGISVGDVVSLGGRPATVVGESRDTSYYFALPTVFAPIGDVQQAFLAGQPFATAIAVRGAPTSLPPETVSYAADAAVGDLKRPLKAGTDTIRIISGLLWVMAAGVVASMLYLAVTERSTDLATSKAMGVTNRTLFAGLAIQGLVLALAATAIGAVVALLIAPVFPFPVEIPTSAYVTIVIIGVAVGLLASLVGLRRTMRVDPALAFGA
jgi:putative ABC transport system permease protein